MPEKQVILHVSDWNYQDKYYQAPISLVKEMGRRILECKDIRTDDEISPWDFWIGQVNYDDKPEEKDKPIKFGLVDMTLDLFFLDYNNPIESAEEWDD